MNCKTNSSNINKTFIIEPTLVTEGKVLSACTAMYTNFITPCSGDTVSVGAKFSAITLDAITILSGGTDLGTLLSSTDIFTTASTLVDQTVYFDRNDQLSAFTLDLSNFNTIITGFTYDGINQFVINDSAGNTFSDEIRELLNIRKVDFEFNTLTATTSGFTVDASSHNIFDIELQTNIELDYTGATNGTYHFIIRQDSTGNRIISYANNKFQAPSGTAPVLTTTSGATDVITGVYDGNKMLIVGVNDFQNI